MKISKETGRRILLSVTIVMLWLSLPAGMDAKKRSNRSTKSTTTARTAAPQKTIVLEDIWGVKIILYPSGQAEYIGDYKSNGTWAQRTRTIGSGTKQIYYEINLDGKKNTWYWVKGSNDISFGYSNFYRNSSDASVKWYYL